LSYSYSLLHPNSSLLLKEGCHDEGVTGWLIKSKPGVFTVYQEGTFLFPQ
jgi:hypothetical protein